jgi:hypothetical protein
MSGLHANFVTNPSGMAASLSGELVFGIPGESGGYYTIDVTQPNDTTMRLTFTPSQSTMAPIPAADITLPHGPKGDPGQADAQQVHALVEEYLAKNPPKVTESDPTVPQWAKAKDKPSYTAAEVGAVSTDALPDAIDEALAQAKESGEFDGFTPDFSIGTVQTLDAGSNATASISGTKENPVLNLGIPRGDDGSSDAGDDWELLNTITVSDDATTNVTFTEDSNGNPLDLKKFYLRVSGITGASTYPVLRLNGLIWQQQFGGAVKGGTNLTIPVLFEIIGYGCYCCEWHDPFKKEIRFDGVGMTHIDSVNSIYWGWATGKTITNGAIFTLYGVRA